MICKICDYFYTKIETYYIHVLTAKIPPLTSIMMSEFTVCYIIRRIAGIVAEINVLFSHSMGRNFLLMESSVFQ